MGDLLRKTSRVFEMGAVIFIVVLFGSVIAQVVLRDVFLRGSIVLEELARFSLISLVYLMIPVLSLDRKQIIVDIVIARLGPSPRRLFAAIVQVLILASGTFLLVAIEQIMRRNWNVLTPAIRMPNYVFYAPAALGLMFMAVVALYEIVAIFRNEGETR